MWEAIVDRAVNEASTWLSDGHCTWSALTESQQLSLLKLLNADAIRDVVTQRVASGWCAMFGCSSKCALVNGEQLMNEPSNFKLEEWMCCSPECRSTLIRLMSVCSSEYVYSNPEMQNAILTLFPQLKDNLLNVTLSSGKSAIHEKQVVPNRPFTWTPADDHFAIFAQRLATPSVCQSSAFIDCRTFISTCFNDSARTACREGVRTSQSFLGTVQIRMPSLDRSNSSLTRQGNTVPNPKLLQMWAISEKLSRLLMFDTLVLDSVRLWTIKHLSHCVEWNRFNITNDDSVVLLLLVLLSVASFHDALVNEELQNCVISFDELLDACGVSRSDFVTLLELVFS